MTHGPPGVFGLRNVYRFSSDPLAFLRQMTDEHGDFVELKLLGQPWFLVNHPDDIETVLVKHAAIMLRDEYVEVMKRTLGLGLLTSEGALWKRQRKLMAQAFTPKRIRTYAETMVAVTDEGVSWTEGEEINLHQEMSRLTMEVVSAVLFGASIGPREVGTVRRSMEAVNEFYANSPEAILKVPAWVPTPRNRRLDGAVKNLDALIYEIIGRRRRGEARDDLLGTLLDARDEGTRSTDGKGMSDQQLRDEAVTLFLAGHETTALALAHTVYLLSKHPEVERRLARELTEVLGGRLPSAADVSSLVYTERVLKESMRLYPPAWTIGREVAEAFELRGRQIPKGAQLLSSQWIVHRDPRWFPNPEAFDPDRWLPERTATLPRFAYFPFGGGPRVCIGNHFAMMEATLMLAILFSRHHFALLPEQRLEFVPSVTLRPKGSGLRVRVTARD
ncbi:MAG: cytochrome P450 [Deltaproteobacteria bacterium]|nr:cytochrome P450 [Deltaproteobacteria bacterium]